MAKSTRHRQIGGSRIVRTGHGGLWALARRPPPDLSRDGRRRLAMVDWHAAHGRNVSLTARHFGVSRPTVYRWLGRFERLRLETLEDLQAGLAAWEVCYNTVRPHQALGYLTPAEYLASIGVQV